MILLIRFAAQIALKIVKTENEKTFYIFFYCGYGMVIREHAHYLVEMLKDIHMLSCCFLVGVYFHPICSGQNYGMR
jgi:hypothetical protein